MAQTVGGLRRFPRGLSPLLGREREVGELTGFVLGSPLVTVTGPGGVGKTRLAVEVARAVGGEFPDGVHFVDLGSVTDQSRVTAEVAAVLGVAQVPGAALGETLAEALAQQRTLLILDNCEQVVTAVAELCAELLAAADDLHILATSREQLWVAGEVRYRLSPLALPVPGEASEIGRSAAVALFAERARRAAPRFALSAAVAPLAARVVTRLDGMPLAIELAAARVEALGLPGLADRIDDALDLLESRDARAASRHQSLTAVAEWSYQLLSGNGQRVFRRLAVFPGPFTLEAVQAVAGPRANGLVLQLVDCSLVNPPQPGPDGRMRYALLQTLRDYGRGLLAEAGEEAPAMAALAAFALLVAGQAAAGLATSDDRELAALRHLDAEDATLAAALDWSLGQDPEIALRLAVALAPWWIAQGRATDGYTRLAAAVELSAGSHAADAQLWLGFLARARSDNIGSAAHFSAAVEAAADLLSRTALLSLAGRSATRVGLDQPAGAEEDAERAVALARQAGDRVAEAFALAVHAQNAYLGGRNREALAWSRQAVDCLPAEAPGRIARPVRNVRAIVLSIDGQYDDSRQLSMAALAWCREAGDLAGVADHLSSLVYLEDLAGNAGAMAAYLHEAVDINVRIGRRHWLRHCLEEGGNLCAATGRWAEAVTLWAAHDAEVERLGFPETGDDGRREDLMRHIETVLEPDQLRAAQERGSRMTLAAAAEFVSLLTEPADPVPPQAAPRDTASSHPSPPEPVPPELGAPGRGDLTPRERELVALVAQGRTNAEIAGQLFISAHTVASHLDRIRTKTGARRRADLTRLALRESLV
jgi:predicted ATPase/DNA-binding CsgD family transcriptional regulator